MGRKHGKKDKKRVLTLAELYEETPGSGPAPEAAALPTAPKALEDWEKEGGRPEYNQRGYKERSTPFNKERRSGYDDDFDDRDWTRKGPLEDEGPGFGNPQGERDWTDMRRGPVDGPDGGDGAPRDWDSMRRGPVDSAYDGRPSSDMDWNSRKGPVDADGPSAPERDADWGAARKGPVQSQFEPTDEDRDWSSRKGPVDAESSGAPDADWGAARKGPVESQFDPIAEEDRDWSSRKGPMETDPALAPRAREEDWGAIRSGSGVDAAAPVNEDNEEEKEKSDAKPDASLDWSTRRGPMKTREESESKTEKPATREVDFGDMRRGAKLRELKSGDGERDGNDRDVGGMRSGGRWRGGRGGGRPASTGHEGGQTMGHDRDWRSARTRSYPVNVAVAAVDTTDDDGTGGGDADGTKGGHSKDWANVRGGGREKMVTEDGDDEWTTVRAAPHRDRAFSRRGSGSSGGGRMPRRGGGMRGGAGRMGGDMVRSGRGSTSSGNEGMRAAMMDGGKANTSPVTPAAVSSGASQT